MNTTTFLIFVFAGVGSLLEAMAAGRRLLRWNEASSTIKPCFSPVLLPGLLQDSVGCVVPLATISSQGSSIQRVTGDHVPRCLCTTYPLPSSALPCRCLLCFRLHWIYVRCVEVAVTGAVVGRGSDETGSSPRKGEVIDNRNDGNPSDLALLLVTMGVGPHAGSLHFSKRRWRHQVQSGGEDGIQASFSKLLGVALFGRVALTGVSCRTCALNSSLCGVQSPATWVLLRVLHATIRAVPPTSLLVTRSTLPCPFFLECHTVMPCMQLQLWCSREAIYVAFPALLHGPHVDPANPCASCSYLVWGPYVLHASSQRDSIPTMQLLVLHSYGLTRQLLLWWCWFDDFAFTWVFGWSSIYLRRQHQQYLSVIGMFLKRWLHRPVFHRRYARSVHLGARVFDAPANTPHRQNRLPMHFSRRCCLFLWSQDLDVFWSSFEDLYVIWLL